MILMAKFSLLSSSSKHDVRLIKEQWLGVCSKWIMVLNYFACHRHMTCQVKLSPSVINCSLHGAIWPLFLFVFDRQQTPGYLTMSLVWWIKNCASHADQTVVASGSCYMGCQVFWKDDFSIFLFLFLAPCHARKAMGIGSSRPQIKTQDTVHRIRPTK